MAQNGYVRLRQVCLATPSLAGVEETIGDVLGLHPCFHDPAVAQFGLENTLFAINGSFLEVVAPVREGTAVDRFLARSGGRGGYMAIFDCDDLAAVRARAQAHGVRVAFALQSEFGEGVQLHPVDMGGALIEFDHHAAGDDRFGDYAWAGGSAWRASVRTDRTTDLLGVEIETPLPNERARLWSALMNRAATTPEAGVATIVLEHGAVVFRAAEQGAREALVAVDLAVRALEPVLHRARVRGLAAAKSSFELCGVTFRLHVANG